MDSVEQILRRFIADQAAIVLQLRTGSGSVEMETNLLKEGEFEGERGIWARTGDPHRELLDRMIESGSPVLVKIPDGQRQLSFITYLVARHHSMFRGERLLIAWPAALKSKERRRRRRMPISRSSSITAALIRAADQCFDGAGLPLQVYDLGTHGGCFICPAGWQPNLAQGERIEIRLGFHGSEHRIAARHRRVEPHSNNQVRLGVEFISQELSSFTANELARLVEELHTCRVRQGLNSAMAKALW